MNIRCIVNPRPHIHSIEAKHTSSISLEFDQFDQYEYKYTFNSSSSLLLERTRSIFRIFRHFIFNSLMCYTHVKRSLRYKTKNFTTGHTCGKIFGEPDVKLFDGEIFLSLKMVIINYNIYFIIIYK